MTPIRTFTERMRLRSVTSAEPTWELQALGYYPPNTSHLYSACRKRPSHVMGTWAQSKSIAGPSRNLSHF